MANGYIHISRKDVIFDNDNNVVYWKNGARYLGEIAKAVLNQGEETEVAKYYLKSAVTKKAILIDAGVIVGGGDYYFITDDANFINVRIETADFSSDGGGDGVTVTFLLPESKYYTVYYVEENGDIKLYDADGDAGSLVDSGLPDTADATAGDALILDADKMPTWDAIPAPIIPKKYIHYLYIFSSGYYLFTASYIDDKSSIVKKDFFEYIYNNGFTEMTNFYPGVTGAFPVNSDISRIWCGAYSSNGASCSGVFIKNDGTLGDFSIASATFTIKTLEI